MILLDTDHLTVLRYPEDRRYAKLRVRMESASGDTFATTIVCLEEQMRGWLALIKRFRDFDSQIPAYDCLQKMLDFFEEWDVIPFDTETARICQRLRKQRVRIGTQDLKIAAIALGNDALLLSANLRDFKQIVGLRVENWLE